MGQVKHVTHLDGLSFEIGSRMLRGRDLQRLTDNLDAPLSKAFHLTWVVRKKSDRVDFEVVQHVDNAVVCAGVLGQTELTVRIRRIKPPCPPKLQAENFLIEPGSSAITEHVYEQPPFISNSTEARLQLLVAIAVPASENLRRVACTLHADQRGHRERT